MPDTDLTTAYEAIKAKGPRMTALWNYYDGAHPLRYSTDRLRQMFDAIHVRFVENWCGVVVDSAMDRINLSGFVVTDNEPLTDRLNDAFLRTELSLDSDDAHLAALVTGEAFVIVWRNESGDTEAYYNDPRMCHVAYDPGSPRRKLWAAKQWAGEDEHLRLTLYYRDRLEYYRSTKKAENVTTAKDLALESQEANPFGMIPVFHLRRDRRRVLGELDGITTVQDAVNKLFCDMMVSAEFAAYPQRYAITAAEMPDELRAMPGGVWDIPAGDGGGQASSVGQLPAADLDNYLKAMDNLSHAIAIITRTPKHFFWGQAGSPSGEALIALEAPLNKKVTRYIERFSSPWRQLATFLLRLEGQEIDPLEITPRWDRVETVQPRTQSEITQLDVSAGVPLVTSLRRGGWDDAEIEQMQADADEQRDRQSTLGDSILRSFETQFGGGV